MADAKLSILLSAETAQASRGLQILQGQLERLQKLASLPNLSTKQQERLNTLISKTQTETTRLNSVLHSTSPAFGKLNSATNAANNTLINTGRIFQDLPFGILGVANNINPLVESFQRLSQQAKATGTSIGTQLLGALKGGGGIGIAFSLLTSALTFATIGLAGFGRGLFGAKKEAKEAKESFDGLRSTINQVGSEASRVTQLFNALSFGDLNARQTKSAIEELKKINFEYFGQLKNEENLVKDLKSAYDGYISSLVQSAQAKVLSDRITKLFDKKIELQLSISPQFTAQTSVETQEIIGKLTKQLNALGGPIDVVNEKFDSFNEKQRERARIQNQIRQLVTGENVVFVEGTKEVQKQIQQIDLQIQGLIALGNNLNLFENDIRSVGETTKKTTEQLDGQRKILDNLRESIFKGIAQRNEFKPSIFPQIEIDVKNLDTIKQQIDELKGQIQTLESIKIPGLSTSDQVEKLKGYLELLEKIIEQLHIINSTAGKPLPAPDTDDLEKKLKSLKDSIDQSFENLRVDAVSSLAEGIGEAFATGDLQGALTGFVSVIGSGIQAIGKQLIALGFAADRVKDALAALFHNPYAMIAAGVTLVAIGAAIRSSLNNGIQARAHGGPVKAGQPYIVGERGAEFFIPDSSGFILSNNQLKNLSIPQASGLSIPNNRIGGVQSSMQPILLTVDGVVKGQDLRLLLSRIDRSNGFNT